MEENARNKLKKIIHFCKSFGYADHDNISQCIRATLDDAPDKVISFIDLIWKVLKGLDRREKKRDYCRRNTDIKLYIVIVRVPHSNDEYSFKCCFTWRISS